MNALISNGWGYDESDELGSTTGRQNSLFSDILNNFSCESIRNEADKNLDDLYPDIDMYLDGLNKPSFLPSMVKNEVITISDNNYEDSLKKSESNEIDSSPESKIPIDEGRRFFAESDKINIEESHHEDLLETQRNHQPKNMEIDMPVEKEEIKMAYPLEKKKELFEEIKSEVFKENINDDEDELLFDPGYDYLKQITDEIEYFNGKKKRPEEK